MPDNDQIYFCRQCNRYLARSAFGTDNSAWDGRLIYCLECTRHKNARRRAEVAAKYDEWVVRYKLEIGCESCGLKSDVPSVFHIDHLIEGDNQKFGGYRSMRHWFAARGRKLTWVEFQAELSKCQILCANCHAIKTYRATQEHSAEWNARRRLDVPDVEAVNHPSLFD